MYAVIHAIVSAVTVLSLLFIAIFVFTLYNQDPTLVNAMSCMFSSDVDTSISVCLTTAS